LNFNRALYLLLIGQSAGWPSAQMQAIATEGIAKNPLDEDALYEELVSSMVPRWGGSWKELNQFIEQVYRNSRDRRGAELYALLYSEAAHSVDGNLFDETKADWPRVKEGMQRLRARAPQGYWGQRLAYLACLAKDRQTFAQAMRDIGQQPDLQFWSGGGNGPDENYQACLTWARGG
jgi:hypothetical protein